MHPRDQMCLALLHGTAVSQVHLQLERHHQMQVLPHGIMLPVKADLLGQLA